MPFKFAEAIRKQRFTDIEKELDGLHSLVKTSRGRMAFTPPGDMDPLMARVLGESVEALNEHVAAGRAKIGLNGEVE